VLPSGLGTPYTDYAAAYDQATARCRTVTTITASMALSGRAGSTKLRGRIDAGFATPARARLEGIAPFGKPVFVLVAGNDRGTLVLTHEDRVLRDAPPPAIVEALAGVALGADALRTIVSGCGFPDAAPTGGRSLRANGRDWILLALDGGTVYLRREEDAWQLAAAVRAPLTVRYSDFANGRPATIGIRSDADGHVAADIHLRLSDVAINTTLDPRTFDVEVPPSATPLTLDELRRAGPMGTAGSGR
jgi:hypothetical protein